MTQRRMTTLISKTPFLPNPLRKSLEKVEGELKGFLFQRGIQVSISDLAALIEEISPRSSKKVLSYALDFVRPYSSGLGLRVARLSDTQVEIVIPSRSRSQTLEGELNEGVIFIAAMESIRQIWNRHSPLGHLDFSVKEFRFKKYRDIQGTSRLRMELGEGVREKVLAVLRQERTTDHENELAIFDEKDQKVAEISIRTELRWTPALNSTKE